MADYTSKSLSVSEYQILIDSLTKDKELVKKLEKEAAEKEKLIQDLTERVLRAENSAKWIAVRNKDLEIDAHWLSKKLKHAMRVIVDLELEKNRNDPQSSLDEVDEAMYREILNEARSQSNEKGKGRAILSSSLSTLPGGERTARPSPSGSVTGRSRHGGSPLSRLSVLTPRIAKPRSQAVSFPTGSVSSHDIFVEAPESPPRTSKYSFSSSSSSSNNSHFGTSPGAFGRKSVGSSFASSRDCIFWTECPTGTPISDGPYDWLELKSRLNLSDSKLDSLRTFESQKGFGVRLQTSKLSQSNHFVAFLYQPVWYEIPGANQDQSEALYLIDWCPQKQCKEANSYLKKRGVDYTNGDEGPLLHVFTCMTQPPEISGWWYIGSRHCLLVKIPPKVVLDDKVEDFDHLVEYLNERVGKTQTNEEMATMLKSKVNLKQWMLQMLPVDKVASEDFCHSILGVSDQGSSM